jgi:hypothetical protein
MSAGGRLPPGKFKDAGMPWRLNFKNRDGNSLPPLTRNQGRVKNTTLRAVNSVGRVSAF